MTVKLRFASLLLVLLAPALGAAPVPQSTTCSPGDCAAQCDPCGWNFYGCYGGEAICACWNC